jgi:hypothetical protein
MEASVYALNLPPEPDSVHAGAGTASHDISEQHFLGKKDYRFALASQTYKGEHAEIIEECVPHLVQQTEKIIADFGPCNIFVEENVPTGGAINRVDMFGTLDIGLQSTAPGVHCLAIIDWKTGTAPHFPDGIQVREYAIGLAWKLGWLDLPDLEIDLYIIQPRRWDGGPLVMHAKMGRVEIDQFLQEMEAIACATEDPNAKRTPGDHCFFCAGQGRCAEYIAAQSDGLLISATRPDRTLALPDVDSLSIERRVELLVIGAALSSLISEVRKSLLQDALSGETVPGMVLTKTSPHKAYVSTTPLNEWVAVLEGVNLPRAGMFKVERDSPAAIERLAKKHNVKLPPEWNDMWFKPEGQWTLKIDDGKTKALAPPGLAAHPFGPIQKENKHGT